MADLAPLDPKTSALLTLDCQNGIVERVPGSEKIFKPASRALEAARAKGVPVLHVGLGFRPGYPEIPPGHPMFGPLMKTGQFLLGTESAAVHPAIAPRPDELVVVKRRVSAFSGNELEMLLRARGITRLAFFGIATSGIVLSTLRQAADLDFRCVVLKDCCADADEEVHRVLTEKVFPRQADVVDAETFARSLA